MQGRLIALVLAGCLAASACGDGPRKHTIAFLRAVPTEASATEAGIVAELRRGGFAEGVNLEMLGRDGSVAYPDPQAARAAVGTWKRAGIDLVFAFSTTGARTAAEVAPDTAILFLVNDPLATGLVPDEEQPGGRMTGATFRVPADRTLDVARRAIPALDRVGLAYPHDDPAAAPHRDAFERAGPTVGVEVVSRPYRHEDGLGPAVDELVAAGVRALLVSSSPTATRSLDILGAAADRHRLPVIASTDRVPFAVVSLYPDGRDLGARLGRQAVRILSGADPGTISVFHPRRFRLALNDAAARTLGITIGPEVLREADVVRR